MKEVRFFYTPDIDKSNELPKDEASHCTRVLRMTEGDEIMLMDGKGTFYRAEITLATNHRCQFSVIETLEQQRQWKPWLHIAMAPTKLMDRTEWFVEKATEIGVDAMTLLECQFSERKVVKNERIEKILVSAVKQSHKAWVPELSSMIAFRDFVSTPRSGQKFIAHCYEDSDIGTPKRLLRDVLTPGEDCVIMVGPEGDFSVEEVKLAIENGYIPISLGASRLRTETAALAAVHTMSLLNQ